VPAFETLPIPLDVFVVLPILTPLTDIASILQCVIRSAFLVRAEVVVATLAVLDLPVPANVVGFAVAIVAQNPIHVVVAVLA